LGLQDEECGGGAAEECAAISSAGFGTHASWCVV
jgi:hypothetical protein